MTAPDFRFQDQSRDIGVSFDLEEFKPAVEEPQDEQSKFPPPILATSEENKTKFMQWLDEWLLDLISQRDESIKRWSEYEKAYRAESEPYKRVPFEGACNDVIPATAMAVDPIYARLETGIFKQSPVFRLKALKSSFVNVTHALENWIDFYQKNRLKLRNVCSPRFLECTKLGTMVLKTVYDHQVHQVKTYDQDNDWKVVKKSVTRFKGPRVFGVPVNDFLFPAQYQNVQDCPIVAERLRMSYWDLKTAERQKKLANVDALKGQEVKDYTQLETTRQELAGRVDNRSDHDDLILYEVWCRYDIDGDGEAEPIVALYHLETRTILQLRYNWYFHQRYPYTVIPYSTANDSLLGIGIAEMVLPFQRALTKWHQMATDNAYLANIRMFIAKKDSGIENAPRLYTGRVFSVDDPRSDFVPFAVGDIYPSTLVERQNLFGLVEKRTGVSDYLTGRESPIIGSRATATSTIALIQEGTRRVEQVLENIRVGLSEVIENCLYIWVQYGLDGLDEIAFGDDKMLEDLRTFFSQIGADNINGALAVDLSATDATTNKQAQQQMQLQIIQVMMGFYEKLLKAGAEALQAAQTAPQFTEMISDVMVAARKLFRDLLHNYDIRNPDEYLPELERYLNGSMGGAGESQQGDLAGIASLLGGLGVGGGVPAGKRIPAGPPVPTPATPGSGRESAGFGAFTG